MKPVQGTSCRNNVAHPKVGTKSDENNKNRGGGERGRRGAEIDAKVFASIPAERPRSHCLALVLYTSLARTSLLRKLLSAIVVKQELRKTYVTLHVCKGLKKCSAQNYSRKNPHTTTYNINAKKDIEAKSSAFRRHAPKGVSTKLSMPIANFETKIESQE